LEIHTETLLGVAHDTHKNPSFTSERNIHSRWIANFSINDLMIGQFGLGKVREKENTRIPYFERICGLKPLFQKARESGVKLIEALICSLIPGEGDLGRRGRHVPCHVSAIAVGWVR
jgi:hypothetical protein